MGTVAHSDDLRSRVVAEVAAGTSRRQAAERFRVSASSAVRWVRLAGETGSVRPRPRGGKRRSPLAAQADWILALIAAEPDLTLEAIAARVLQERAVTTTEASIRRFFKRHKISFKKNLARGRAGSARRRRGSAKLESGPGEPGSQEAGVHR